MDIEVVAVKSLPGPQGRAFERTLEGRQIAQLDERLAHVQVAAARRPVVIGGLPVGHHHFEPGGRPVVQGLLMFEVHFHIGVGLVAQATNGAAGLPGGGHISAGFGTGGRVVHDHPGTRIAVELKAAGPFGFFFQLSGAPGHLLGGGLGLLLLLG